MDPIAARTLDRLDEFLEQGKITFEQWCAKVAEVHSRVIASPTSPREPAVHTRASSVEKEPPVKIEALDTETQETPVKIETPVKSVKSDKVKAPVRTVKCVKRVKIEAPVKMEAMDTEMQEVVNHLRVSGEEKDRVSHDASRSLRTQAKGTGKGRKGVPADGKAVGRNKGVGSSSGMPLTSLPTPLPIPLPIVKPRSSDHERCTAEPWSVRVAEEGVVKSSKASDSESLSTCGITYDMVICSVSEKSGDDKPSKRHVSSSVPASNSSRAAGIFDVGAGDFAEDFLRVNGLVEPKLHPGGWIADPEDYMYDTNQCGDSPGSIPIFNREQHSLPITPSDNSQGHMATGNSNLGSPRVFDALVHVAGVGVAFPASPPPLEDSVGDLSYLLYDTNQCGDSPGSIPIFHREQHSLPITPSDNSQGHMATGNSKLESPRMFDALVQAWTRLTGKHLDITCRSEYHRILRWREAGDRWWFLLLRNWVGRMWYATQHQLSAIQFVWDHWVRSYLSLATLARSPRIVHFACTWCARQSTQKIGKQGQCVGKAPFYQRVYPDMAWMRWRYQSCQSMGQRILGATGASPPVGGLDIRKNR